MNILFIGCVKSSEKLLNELVSINTNIVGVITKRKSDFNSDFCDLMSLCKKEKIDCRYVENINDEENIEYIKKCKPDLIYCFGWSELLSDKILNIPKLGCVGYHPTELPYNRGRHPQIWAIVLGMKKTASTFFMMKKGADDGGIISQEEVLIDLEDDARSLYEKLDNVAIKQIRKITNDFLNNNIKYIKQDNSKANYWRKRTKADGKIDWRMSTINIYNLVRGLTKPYAGAHLEYEGNEYKVWKASLVEYDNVSYENIEYGKVLKVYDDKSFIVKTGDGVIQIIDYENFPVKEGGYII